MELGPRPAYGQALDPLLAPTPEFDLADPFIVNKAAELNHDPVQIFDFMKNEIGYEAYEGSLRGARGTLWSKAGNALDQASLMIALLRVSGIKARYVKGTLGTAEAQEVILSMFPPVLRIVGCPPADALKADPANDPKLLAEAKDHYWVEYGDSFTPADPTFPEASIGQTFTTKQSDFTEVSDALRHKVTVRLKAERRVEAAIAFGGQSEVKNVLNETFITAALVGKPLSVGHFVNSSPAGGLAFSVITHTYSPYILIGQNDGNIEDDEIIRGDDYQEVITNFPLGNQLLTGLFLEMDVKSPDGKVETHERALVDRIGFAARHNGGTVVVGGGNSDEPAITILDIVTASVEPSLTDPTSGNAQKGQITQLQEEARQLSQLLEGKDPTAFSLTDRENAQQLAVTNSKILTLLTQSVPLSFAAFSQEVTRQLAENALVKAYFDSPRITLTSTKIQQSGQTASLHVTTDLRKDDIRGMPFPGQVSNAVVVFNIARGIAENTVEDLLMSSFSSVKGNNGAVVRQASTAEIFQAAKDQGIALNLITSENVTKLEQFSVSDEAKARLAQAALSGKTVLSPTKNVRVGAHDTIAWFEIDPVSGYATRYGRWRTPNCDRVRSNCYRCSRIDIYFCACR